MNLFSATVAKNLAMDSFGLIFGFNTLMALIIQTLMTVVVVSGSVFELDPKGQYLVFGSYFLVISIVFFVATLLNTFMTKRKE